MSTLITLNGDVINAKTLKDWPTLSQGHSWRNSEPLGETPIWREIPFPIESIGPNLETLFGYEVETFLKKQYR